MTHSKGHVVDTHRHAFGKSMSKKLAQSCLFDADAPFPQVGAGDIVYYREFVDLDFALAQQRQGGVTHSIASNGGEMEWIAADILERDMASAIDFLTEDYLETQQRYPGEFSFMANAHALDEGCRPAVERAVDRGAKAISVSSSYGDGAGREFLDGPKAEWLWEFATAKGLVVHIHPPMQACSHEVLEPYRLNEAIGRPFDSTVNLARMIASGVFDRYPALQVMVVHVGGDIGSIVGRLEFCWQLNYNGISNPPASRVYRNLRNPRDYLKTNVLVDMMGFNPEAVRGAIALHGVERLMLGTDYGPVPFGVANHVEMIDAVARDEDERQAMRWRNSAKWFGLELHG